MILFIMFDHKELKLMFLDPLDLVVVNINKYLISQGIVKNLFFPRK